MTVREELKDAFAYWDRLFAELNNQSDRVATITAAAFFEDALERAIESKFVPLSKTKREKIFDGQAPLSTFSAKIEIGYALGLYGVVARADLHKTRKIRNLFAHTAEPLEFSEPDIAKIASELTTPRTMRTTGHWPFGADTPRGLYMTTLWYIRRDIKDALGIIEGL